MVDFKKLKSGNITRLAEEINKINNPEASYAKEDDRFWQPEVDKAGNGYAVIRFLPAPAVDGDDALPWVRVFKHSFQGPTGSWYIENSLTTLGQTDPVSEYNTTLWNSGSEADKEVARKQKRKLQYIANIFIVEDSANPENVGKIKLYRFGKKIFDKISEAMNPEFKDEEAFNPFDFWKGANFKLKIRQVEGYRNYDKSEFDKPSPLSEDDKELEKIWNSEFSLKEFVDPSQFKPYAVLKQKFERVIGIDKKVAATKQAKLEEEDLDEVVTEDGDDEELQYFKDLANE